MERREGEEDEAEVGVGLVHRQLYRGGLVCCGVCV